MKQPQYTMTTSLTKDLLSAIDDIRGDIPRSIFVRRAVEQKVSELNEYRNKKIGGKVVQFSRPAPLDHKDIGTGGVDSRA